jgi:hypothetical protein
MIRRLEAHAMTQSNLSTLLASALMALVLAAAPTAAQSTIPTEFQGDWVLQTASCQAALKFRVAPTTLTLVNGADTQSWGNVGMPPGFFGPDYQGISVVALPDFDKTQPFTVYFNADEKKGVARVEIFVEMRGRLNPQVAALQAAARRLAMRFPLNNLPLKKC